MATRIILAALIAASSLAPAQAAFVRTVPAEYAKFAACAFTALDRQYPTLMRLTDLRGADTIKITMDETAVGLIGSAANRIIDIDVRKAGSGSAIEIRSAWTILGSDFYAERTWREIRECLPVR